MSHDEGSEFAASEFSHQEMEPPRCRACPGSADMARKPGYWIVSAQLRSREKSVTHCHPASECIKAAQGRQDWLGLGLTHVPETLRVSSGS